MIPVISLKEVTLKRRSLTNLVAPDFNLLKTTSKPEKNRRFGQCQGDLWSKKKRCTNVVAIIWVVPTALGLGIDGSTG